MNDRDIRPMLREELARSRAGSIFVDEVPLHTWCWDDGVRVRPSRIDVLSVGPLIEAFEIKGQNDAWTRLDNQLLSYAMVCERVWVVTTVGKVRTAAALAPEWCGVLYVANDGTRKVDVFREAQPHDRYRFQALRQVLWLPEWKKILKRRGVKCGASARCHWVWQLVERHLTIPEMLDEIRKQLPLRRNWR